MRNREFSKNIFTAIVTSIGTVILLVLFLFGYAGMKLQQQPNTKGESANVPNQQVPAPQQISAEVPQLTNAGVSNVASGSIQSVVGIAVLRPDGNSIFDTKANEKWGIGSGIIVDSSGYILTNHHVAGGKSKKIVVTLTGGQAINGVTLWSDPVIDLAVVKINITGLPSAKLGDAKVLRVGEPAIAIGNPLGLQFQRTVTSGIISALNRTVKIETEQGSNFMEDLIQTDASINPGNSGGPLMNNRGEVIGVNTIKVESAEGLGFAIPINIARPIVNSFINRGRFDEPYLGLFAYDREIMPYVSTAFSNISSGVYVTTVDETGPAAKSGINKGDVISKIDGVDIHTMGDLRTIIYGKLPSQTINLTVISSNGVKQVPVILGRKSRDGLLTR